MWDWNPVSTTARSAHYYHGVNNGAKGPLLSRCLGLRPRARGSGFALAVRCALAARCMNLYVQISTIHVAAMSLTGDEGSSGPISFLGKESLFVAQMH